MAFLVDEAQRIELNGMLYPSMMESQSEGIDSVCKNASATFSMSLKITRGAIKQPQAREKPLKPPPFILFELNPSRPICREPAGERLIQVHRSSLPDCSEKLLNSKNCNAWEF